MPKSRMPVAVTQPASLDGMPYVVAANAGASVLRMPKMISPALSATAPTTVSGRSPRERPRWSRELERGATGLHGRSPIEVEPDFVTAAELASRNFRRCECALCSRLASDPPRSSCSAASTSPPRRPERRGGVLDGERRLDQHDGAHPRRRRGARCRAVPPVTAPPTMTASPPPLARRRRRRRPPRPPTRRNSTLAAMHTNCGQPAGYAARRVEPARVGTTLHFTFGSIVMRDFVRNWMLSSGEAGAGARRMRRRAAARARGGGRRGGGSGELDVWTYTRKARAKEAVFDLKSDWKYYCHHKSSFLEMGLVKAAFLWELLLMRSMYSYPIWTSSGSTATGRGGCRTPSERAAAAAGVAPRDGRRLSVDGRDQRGARRAGRLGLQANTGVLFFRCTKGSLAAVQAWRSAMMRMRDGEFLNDQGIFNNMVHGAGLRRSRTTSARGRKIKRGGGYVSEAGLASATSETREVWLSRPSFARAFRTTTAPPSHSRSARCR